ncbi:MAG: aminotransferase class I/II-fold pyridoxal phosphate-dependent enzyme [candidate division Zixibacteria bacterium]|nr:aminotransferase class I/II-fold pyridoxal phosphate-dependent enzyme [candidate division Zixibacteria bacterium]
MPRDFQPFELERIMSEWEQVVAYNLSESGAHPMRLGELLAYDPSLQERMLETELGYGYAEGAPSLREAIAQYYPGATSENVLVTVGCIEANYLVYTTLLQPGDAVAIQTPNYLQGWGVAHNIGAERRTFSLDPDRGWALDIESMEKAVTDKTRLIAVCNPNNPTGHILTTSEQDAVVRIAEKSGAWVLSDEVYAGAERETDTVTPTLYGRYDRVIASGSLSKAYGLPGLRIGWLVAPKEMIRALWMRHEYLTISAAKLSSHILAPLALRPDVRDSIFARTRQYIRNGWTHFAPWVENHRDMLSLVAPQASAIAFVRYRLKTDSVTLAHRLIRDASVLIGPGDHFGVPGHLRISYGLPPEYLLAGLNRIGRVLRGMRDEA